MRTASLRRRVAVVCLTVLCVALAGFDVFLYSSFDARLTDDLNQQLNDRAGLARVLDTELTSQQLADRLAGAGVRASVRRDGTVYSGRPQAPPAGAAPARPPTPPTPPRAIQATVVRHGQQITLTEPLRDGTLVLSADRGEIDADLSRLLWLEIVGSLAVLAAAALALALLVRRTLRPLDEMTRVASVIATGQTGQRLSPSRTDTELGRMASAFDAMLDSLEDSADSARRSEERMREFLADISHELRTPVAGLVATAEWLLRDGGVQDPEHEQMLISMVRSSGRAARLIDDLLTLGRLEQPDALLRTAVDLAALVRQEAARTQLLAPQATIDLHGPQRLLVACDADRISQAVANLLENARHAIAESGSITLSLSDDGRGRATLTVSDDGRGVPPAERERIFERLVRLDPARSRARFGGGLGLPIARTIVRAHGGELWCEPQPVGARFVMTLPLAVRQDAPLVLLNDG